MSALPAQCVPAIRAMHRSDLAGVVAIERASYRFPWSERIFRDCISTGYCCRVLELDGDLEAFGILSHGAGEAHLLNLCVGTSSRRRGFGRMMLDYLFDVARERGADTVFLEVRPSNHAALALYRGVGFNEVGVRNGYYPDGVGREDAIIFARSIAP